MQHKWICGALRIDFRVAHALGKRCESSFSGFVKADSHHGLSRESAVYKFVQRFADDLCLRSFVVGSAEIDQVARPRLSQIETKSQIFAAFVRHGVHQCTPVCIGVHQMLTTGLHSQNTKKGDLVRVARVEVAPFGRGPGNNCRSDPFGRDRHHATKGSLLISAGAVFVRDKFKMHRESLISR